MPVGKVGMAAINTGLGIVGNAANGLLGMIGQRAREERALGHQKELMDVQFQNQKLLDKYGQDIQLDTWEKTNYASRKSWNGSTPTIKKRIAEIQDKQGVLLQYRNLQALHLTELQIRVLEAITPDKIEEAPLRNLS